MIIIHYSTVLSKCYNEILWTNLYWNDEWTLISNQYNKGKLSYLTFDLQYIQKIIAVFSTRSSASPTDGQLDSRQHYIAGHITGWIFRLSPDKQCHAISHIKFSSRSVILSIWSISILTWAFSKRLSTSSGFFQVNLNFSFRSTVL